MNNLQPNSLEALSVIAGRVVESFRRTRTHDKAAHLTACEEKVQVLLSKGYSNKELADRLNIGFETVRSYLKKHLRKHAHTLVDGSRRPVRILETAGLTPLRRLGSPLVGPSQFDTLGENPGRDPVQQRRSARNSVSARLEVTEGMLIWMLDGGFGSSVRRF